MSDETNETEETIEIAAENEASQLPKNTEFRIVKIGDQSPYSVEMVLSDEDVRTRLLALGFADAGSATIQKSECVIKGERYEVIEFVKKTGTKGSGDDLHRQIVTAILAAPAIELPRHYQPHAEGATIEAVLRELTVHSTSGSEGTAVQQQQEREARACRNAVSHLGGAASIAVRLRHGW